MMQLDNGWKSRGRASVLTSFRHVVGPSVCLLAAVCGAGTAMGQKVRQAPEVVKAYQVCEHFQRLLAQDLDFSKAYEATFTKNIARRRKVAIRDGEFSGVDLDTVSDSLLINAYKQRMQLFYLMLVLAGPDNNDQERSFFPPNIKQILDRKPAADPKQFGSYVSQLEQDVRTFKEHLDHLARENANVATRIQKFKTEVASGPFDPPKDYLVKPQVNTDESRGLSKGEKYYAIEGYSVIREGVDMKIVSIRFFTRLF
jgi:hypothetical protein